MSNWVTRTKEVLELYLSYYIPNALKSKEASLLVDQHSRR